jgi:hypothetical protein
MTENPIRIIHGYSELVNEYLEWKKRIWTAIYLLRNGAKNLCGNIEKIKVDKLAL